MLCLLFDKHNYQSHLLSCSPVLSIAQFLGNVPLSILISLECELYTNREYDLSFDLPPVSNCGRVEISVTLESGGLISCPVLNYLCDLRPKKFNICTVFSFLPDTVTLPSRM